MLMMTAKVTKPSITSGLGAPGCPAMASSIWVRIPSVLIGVRIMLSRLRPHRRT